MPTPDPKSYADQWVRAWNAHDVEAVLDHFRDDVVFTSPVAARVVPESGGVVRGKAALRNYWSTALSQQADLQFEVDRPKLRTLCRDEELPKGEKFFPILFTTAPW